MAWWISLLLLSMATLLWKKSCDSTDDVIALLERILATTNIKVVARIRSSNASTSSVLSQLFVQSNAAMLSNSKLIHQAITPVPMGSV